MTALKFPYPISANRYWRSIVNKKTMRVMVFVSDEAKQYRHECGWIARAAGVKPTRSLVELVVRLVPENRVCMDLDNALKVVIDALKGVAYVDDAQVRKIVAERCEPDGRKRLEVEIRDYQPAVPELFREAECSA